MPTRPADISLKSRDVHGTVNGARFGDSSWVQEASRRKTVLAGTLRTGEGLTSNAVIEGDRARAHGGGGLRRVRCADAEEVPGSRLRDLWRALRRPCANSIRCVRPSIGSGAADERAGPSGQRLTPVASAILPDARVRGLGIARIAPPDACGPFRRPPPAFRCCGRRRADGGCAPGGGPSEYPVNPRTAPPGDTPGCPVGWHNPLRAVRCRRPAAPSFRRRDRRRADGGRAARKADGTPFSRVRRESGDVGARPLRRRDDAQPARTWRGCAETITSGCAGRVP